MTAIRRDLPYGIIKGAAELGSLVRRKRLESGFLQAEAAAHAGIGTRFLSELERGKQTAEIGKVLQVLDRFGLVVSVVPRGTGWEKADG